MVDETMKIEELVEKYRKYAEWAEGNIWEVPVDLPDVLQQAADELIADVAVNSDVYKKGLNDAWKAAIRIVEEDWPVRHAILKDGTGNLWEMLRSVKPEDAIEAIKKYDEESNFKVGDVVKVRSMFGVVIAVDGMWVDVLNKDGSTQRVSYDGVTRTSAKMPEVGELFAKLGSYDIF